jgi:hypothetical protein
MDRFWSESKQFVGPPLTLEQVKRAESALGYKLPQSYIQLILWRNGGTPIRTCFRTSVPTSWAQDHIAISGIKGIGGRWGIDSPEFGSRVMSETWGYPRIGVVVCECPSAGHDVVMLDYRACGPSGEPSVVHVETECSAPVITSLCGTFQEFVDGLCSEEALLQG